MYLRYSSFSFKMIQHTTPLVQLINPSHPKRVLKINKLPWTSPNPPRKKTYLHYSSFSFQTIQHTTPLVQLRNPPHAILTWKDTKTTQRCPKGPEDGVKKGKTSFLPYRITSPGEDTHFRQEISVRYARQHYRG